MNLDDYPPEIAAAIEAAARRGQEIGAVRAQGDPAATAILATMGIYPVSVVTGPIQTPQEAALYGGLRTLADECGTCRHTYGDGESNTYLFDGEGAAYAAAAFADAVVVRDVAGWWRVTLTALPVYGSDPFGFLFGRQQPP